jgi:ribosomal protein S18 acetylase RimI-like enzyme
MAKILVKPVPSAYSGQALELLFKALAPADCTNRVAVAQALLQTGELHSDGLIGAYDDTRLVGIALCTHTPGALGIVWPPAVTGWPKQDIEDQLVQGVCRWLREQGVKLAQTLLEPAQTQLAEPLERQGFARITTLHYLRHELGERTPADAQDSLLDFLPLPDVQLDQFTHTLLRTYEGSADVPELDGLRTGEEIVAGHQAQGRFNPGTWWLIRRGVTAVGVLLVNELESEPGWDVVYLGVVPEARGTGIGRQLIQHVLRQAALADVRFVDVCVDSRNLFAHRLYEVARFSLLAERVVWLARLEHGDSQDSWRIPCRR